MDIALFYSKLREQGLAPQAHQWASLVTCSQERLVYRKALERVSPGARCLDWGCGNGHFSWFLAQHGFRPDAFALSEKPVLLLDLPGITFTRGNDRVALPYPSSTFDAVFGLGVLEHLAEHGGSETGSLAELARVLKPGGQLLLFHLPNRWSWIENAKWCTWRLGLTTTREHVRRFSRRDFLDLIDSTAFDVIEEGRYHLLPRATLGRLPGLRNSPAFSSFINALDDALAWALRPITQNRYFVLRKEAA